MDAEYGAGMEVEEDRPKTKEDRPKGDQRADPQDCILGGRCSKTGNSVAGVIRVIPSNVGCADHPQYANGKNEQ